MNILHISSNFPPQIGGPASSVPSLAEEQAKLGHVVYVLTRGVRGFPSSDVVNGVNIRRSPYIPGNFYNPIIAFLSALAMGWTARTIILSKNIDFVHAHDMNVSSIAGIIGTAFMDVKRVVKFPGDLAWELMSLSGEHGRNPADFFSRRNNTTKILHKIQKYMCNHYDLVIAPSEYMKDCLIKYMNLDDSRVVVVYNGVNAHKYTKKHILSLRKKILGDNKSLVLSASRLVPWKGLDYLIDAFRHTPRDMILVIAGEGPIKKRLEWLARDLNVVFLGKIPYNELQAYLYASDIFVLPSIYEPSAVALLDCLATGTPIIATSVGGTPEIIKNNKTGVLIREKSAEDIVQALNTLSNDTKLYMEIKRNQKNELKKYLWKSMAKKYLDVYTQVLKYD